MTDSDRLPMDPLLTAAQMRAADDGTTERLGLPAVVLMERAALALKARARHWMESCRLRRCLVFAGRGNNGADGLATARLLAEEGLAVTCYRLPGPVEEDSLNALQEGILRGYAVPLLPLDESFWEGQEPEEKAASFQEEADSLLIIDALTGIGAVQPLRQEAGWAVRFINTLGENGAVVLAADLPSGLHTDTGAVLGEAVRAEETVTFGFYKRAHVLDPGRRFCGRLVLAPIGIARAFLPTQDDREAAMGAWLSQKPAYPRREVSGNKGSAGKLLLLGGAKGMAGAALMAARSAYRSGTGMVRMASVEDNREILQTTLPEAVLSLYPAASGEVSDEADRLSRSDFEDLIFSRWKKDLAWADVVLAGPGLGTGDFGALLLRLLLEALQANAKKNTPRGLVLDADALNLLAKEESLQTLLAGRDPGVRCILTPHVAELARLLKTTVEACKTDLAGAAIAAARRFHCTVLAKDARS